MTAAETSAAFYEPTNKGVFYMKKIIVCWGRYCFMGLILLTAAGRGLVCYDGWDKSIEAEVLGHEG